MRRLVTGCLAAAASIAVLGVPPPGLAATKGSSSPRAPHLANSCFALRSETTGKFVSPGRGSYRADSPVATGFFWKPASLRDFLPLDPAGGLLGIGQRGVVRAASPGPDTAWRAVFLGGRTIALRSRADGR